MLERIVNVSVTVILSQGLISVLSDVDMVCHKAKLAWLQAVANTRPVILAMVVFSMVRIVVNTT